MHLWPALAISAALCARSPFTSKNCGFKQLAYAGQEHWCSSGFANTDLDRLLKKQGIHRLIVIGLIAHTCVEASVRFAAELGYEVTMVKDAPADYSDEEVHAALDVNLPNYASAIVPAGEIANLISSPLNTETAA